jgi:hypothetical protein
VRSIEELTGSPAEILGWAGPTRADRAEVAVALALAGAVADPLPAAPGACWLPSEQVLASSTDAAFVAAAKAILAGAETGS